ncbi:MAG: DUF4258 domain-containing protein [Rudaea sp.]|uniref:DUF4258 domain-containing protein n=1 Tax=Rudaea sp. TaxID=2136325 RepID=UPI0039E289E0
MADFFSARFGKNVWITTHARASMTRRNIGIALLEEVIEEGEIKRSSETSLWIFKHVEGRSDNLVCAAVVEQAALVWWSRP